MPNVIAVLNPDGTVGITPSLGRPQMGLMTVRTVGIVDGYGRSVEHTGLHEYRLEPVRPKPKPTYRVEFKVENTMSDELRDLLFGRERRDEG
ncbi:hypothetical protein [Microbacterium sp. K24]|uniref:hypothetical protein n=1 Tax=Microbacterium sp. K24 TaxID=2305446 RepID=UPI00109D6F40|nr:hypothetical protein [Microbacterium sp. K24]